MSLINIRGYIADADYDGAWAEAYIERGLWTPDSKVRRDLAAAKKDEPLTVRVSSPGGSVFAGYEMANAIRDWTRETGQAVAVEVGALAASMGSYLAFFLSPSVAIHRNTKAMFHGAAAGTFGGKEAHEDAAELLATINAEIKGNLVAKGIAPETADEWLAEGRMGWMDAAQIVEHGMAQTVLDADAPAEKPDAKIMEGAINAAQTAGKLALAAALTEGMNDGCDKPGDAASEPPPPIEPPAAAADAGPGVDADELAAQMERIVAERDAARNDAAAAIADADSARDGLRNLQSKHDKLIAETKTLRDAHDALRAKWDRLTGVARAADVSNGQTTAGGANGEKGARRTVGIWQK